MIFCLAGDLKMNNLRLNDHFFSIILLITVICIIPPVVAQSGTVTISYRGAGGYYIGDTIIFDGKDTVGNSTLLKITGPGLPPTGVPIYDLEGIPGSGNTVPMDTDGSWRFVWSTANIKGIDKLVTARYTVTAFDLIKQDTNCIGLIFFKKA